MKREFLKALGLTDEAIDKVMAENGKDIEKGKASEGELAALKSQLTERDKSITTLQGQLAGNQAAADALKAAQAQLAEKDKAIANTRKEAAIQVAITGAKAKNAKAVMALLDAEKLELGEDGTVKGLTEALEGIKKSDGYLFEGQAGAPNVPPAPPAGGFNPPPAGGQGGGTGAQAPTSLYAAVKGFYEGK